MQHDNYTCCTFNLNLSSILPARMGDLGWIYFIHRWLEMPAARAIFVALYHRLQDFIVVSLMFALSIAAARVEIIGANFAFSAIGILLLMCLIWAFLPRMLGMLGACLWILHRRFGNRMLKAALRQVLRVRIWYRHRLTRRQVVVTFTVIAVRWLTILVALSLLIHALATSVNAADSFFLSNAYVFLGIVPLQSVGGFGAGEAGLAWGAYLLWGAAGTSERDGIPATAVDQLSSRRVVARDYRHAAHRPFPNHP